MPKLWRRADTGELLRGADGKLIRCDVCPCEDCVPGCPAGPFLDCAACNDDCASGAPENTPATIGVTVSGHDETGTYFQCPSGWIRMFINGTYSLPSAGLCNWNNSPGDFAWELYDDDLATLLDSGTFTQVIVELELIALVVYWRVTFLVDTVFSLVLLAEADPGCRCCDLSGVVPAVDRPAYPEADGPGAPPTTSDYGDPIVVTLEVCT